MKGAEAFGARLKGALPFAALLVAGGYLYGRTGSFAYAAREGELGPDIWPKAILVLLMLVCGAEIVRRALPAGAGREDRPTPAANAAAGEEQRYPWVLAAGIALTALYVPGIEALGFFLATAIYLAAFMWIGRYRRAGVIAASSVLGSLAFVFVFMKIVYVSLPLGVGPFKELSTLLLAALGIR